MFTKLPVYVAIAAYQRACWWRSAPMTLPRLFLGWRGLASRRTRFGYSEDFFHRRVQNYALSHNNGVAEALGRINAKCLRSNRRSLYKKDVSLCARALKSNAPLPAMTDAAILGTDDYPRTQDRLLIESVYRRGLDPLCEVEHSVIALRCSSIRANYG